MSIGPPPPEVCFDCGALVPHKMLPEYDGVPGQIICQPERYESGMFEHSNHCPRKPADQESSARLKEAKERLSSWIGEVATVAIGIPLSLHDALLEKAKSRGVSLGQHCTEVLLQSLT